MNQTPLMAAATAGNLPLVEALLERGADRDKTDDYGRKALHWAMLEAFTDAKYATGPFASMYELIAPSSIDLMVGERLIRIDQHLSEYFLVQTMLALNKVQFHNAKGRDVGCFSTATILDAWRHLPRHIVRPERNKRPHLSSLLSRNEVNRDYAYNRRLFIRQGTGRYQFNPGIAVRRQTADGAIWQPIFLALNLPLIKEYTIDWWWPVIDDLLSTAAIVLPPEPILGELTRQRREKEAEALGSPDQDHRSQEQRIARADYLTRLAQQMTEEKEKKHGRRH